MNAFPVAVLRLKAPSGAKSGVHPVQAGMPLPAGFARARKDLRLVTHEGRTIPCDIDPLLSWPDGSFKWVRLRFLVRWEGDESEREFRLASTEGLASPLPPTPFMVEQKENQIQVHTGTALFTLDRRELFPFRQVNVARQDLLRESVQAPVLLRDARGRSYRLQLEDLHSEYDGRLWHVLEWRGHLRDAWGRRFCRAFGSISFFAGTALSRIEITLWNSEAARHPNGLWDLGDPGSRCFRSFTMPFPLSEIQPWRSTLSLNPDAESLTCPDAGCVHQSGSGHDNWESLAHVDRLNRVTPQFRGFRYSTGKSPETKTGEGDRANPALWMDSGEFQAAFALEDFWQRFPSRLSVSGADVGVEPFPEADGQEFELQGGERARFVIWADFAPEARHASGALPAARQPLLAVPDAHWVAASQAIPHLRPCQQAKDPLTASLLEAALEESSGLFSLREKFQEFGWRNFGEVPADHEKQHYNGKREFISHYNNQYDLVLSFLHRFLQGGDTRWLQLGRDLALHVENHDIYHTKKDKSAYNGGYFWHTAHYMHAGTATHRTFSRRAVETGSLPPGFGGGPSNEHNYTSGLALYHLLSGDSNLKNTVLDLAAWVENMQNGDLTPFRFLARGKTGLATCTRHLEFQGPGRGAGYSINACLDAYILGEDRRWLVLAEEFIATCIHPHDNPEAMGLLHREDRWSYVVFLQILGRYLEEKRSLREFDAPFWYARESLLAYARWMARREYPYLDKPEELEFPTSAWAAQEFRKPAVFALAARFGPAEDAPGFSERAAFFLRRAREDLQKFEDRASVRNLAIVLYCLPVLEAWESDDRWNLGLVPPRRSTFTSRRELLPQKIVARHRAKRILSTGGLAGLVYLAGYIRKRMDEAEG